VKNRECFGEKACGPLKDSKGKKDGINKGQGRKKEIWISGKKRKLTGNKKPRKNSDREGVRQHRGDKRRRKKCKRH